MNVLEARRRLLGRNVYKRTTEGNPAIAQGSLARRYPGVTMQGWTEQDSTTGAQLFDASLIPTTSQGGATVTNNGDGSFTISGEGQLTQFFLSSASVSGDDAKKMLKAGNIYTNGSYYVPRFYAYGEDNVGTVLFSTNLANGSAVITNEILENLFRLTVVFFSSKNSVITPVTFSPMLWQTGDGTYEPYTGGIPSPNGDYPQPITSAGKYNEDTQKWEFEITIANEQTDPDKNQTVTLTSDRTLTKWDRLEKRNGQWGWVYKSAEIVLDGSEEWSLYPIASSGTVFLINLSNATFGLQTSLCDKYRNINYAWEVPYNGMFGIYGDNTIVTNKYFRPPSADVETVEQWKTWLQSNPLTLWYETAEETFVPLTTAEQEAMNALYTFRPTTVLSNQQGCQMALTYKTRKGVGVTYLI